MLLTQLRRLARGAESEFSAVEGAVDASSFALEASALSEAEAEVVEGDRLRAIPVGEPAESAFTSFLDGIQRSAVVLYHGPVPIVYAYAAAVVRTRRGRRMATLESDAGTPPRSSPPERRGDAAKVEEALAASPPRRVAASRGALSTRYQAEREAAFFPFRLVDPAEVAAAGIAPGVLRDTSPPAGEPLPLFPPVLYARAAEAVNRWRESLESALAKRWCQGEDDAGWLLVDGSLTLTPELAASPRAVGLIKSHRTRFFDGDEARVLLGLRAGERSSVFQPRTRSFTPVHSWYLRLRSPAGRDVFWGLVRVEVAAEEASLARADEISRWLLAETAPLALPDARWDRLLYPIRDCEEYLRTRAPNL